MKYALILYGGMRSYNFSSKTLFDNLLNINHEIDIFISTHKENAISSFMDYKQSFNNVYGEHLKSISFIEDNDNSYLFKLLKEKIKIIDNDLYNNYKDEIENINNFNDWYIFYKKILNKDNLGCYFKNKSEFTYLLHETIMIYHRLNAFNELEKYKITNNIHYDGVIIYRPDLIFKVPLYLNKFIFDDDIIYIRLEYMFISTYNGIKKFTKEFFENYYNFDYEDEQKNNKYKFISEHQHLIYLYKNYKYVYNILNPLYHYRVVCYTNDQGNLQVDENLLTEIQPFNNNIKEITDNFYDNLKQITDKHNSN